jgi:hypothetical protein
MNVTCSCEIDGLRLAYITLLNKHKEMKDDLKDIKAQLRSSNKSNKESDALVEAYRNVWHNKREKRLIQGETILFDGELNG